MSNFSFLNQKLPVSVYQKDPFFLAQEMLLGAYLCTCVGGILTAGKITELEVYTGGPDRASHSFNNRKTQRNAIQFEPGGRAYIFLIYGLHYNFCVTAGGKDEPNSILIRSLEPIYGLETMCCRRKTHTLSNLTTGPGKLCQALNITQGLYGADLTQNEIWIAPRDKRISPKYIARSPRIGVGYAGAWALKQWRFFLKDSLFLSVKNHPL